MVGLLLVYVIAAKVIGSQPSAYEPPPAAPSIQVVGDTTLISTDEVLRAVSAFRSYCEPLGGKMWADLTKITARVQSEYAPYRRARGWQASIELTLVVPENPRLIPVTDSRVGIVAGHTLWFFIGGGASPGYFASKRVSQMLCGAPIDQSGGDVFVPVPAFSFLR